MKCLRNVVFVAVALSVATTAYGWGPTSHGKAALSALNYPTVSPSLAALGLSASTIANMAWECDLPEWRPTYHDGWTAIQNRTWLTDPKWSSLDESRRLAFLCHNACDSGVPLGHSPANQVWTNSSIENALEARVEAWGGFPGITPYTGTYTNKMNTFYSEEISLAQWSKNNVKSVFEATFQSHGQQAGWNGLTKGQNLCEAMLVEYFATRPAGLMAAAVPEPATMSLLLMGALSLLGYWKWNRR